MSHVCTLTHNTNIHDHGHISRVIGSEKIIYESQSIYFYFVVEYVDKSLILR